MVFIVKPVEKRCEHGRDAGSRDAAGKVIKAWTTGHRSSSSSRRPSAFRQQRRASSTTRSRQAGSSVTAKHTKFNTADNTFFFMTQVFNIRRQKYDESYWYPNIFCKTANSFSQTIRQEDLCYCFRQKKAELFGTLGYNAYLCGVNKSTNRNNMKRLTISLLAIITICAQGFAANLTGKWKTALQEDEKEMPCELTVKESSLLFTINVTEDDDEMGTITMTINIPGNYTVEGNKMRINLEKEGVSIKLSELKPKSPELKAMMESDPEAKAAIEGLLEGLVSAYKDQMLADDNPLDGELTIMELTKTTLTLRDETDKDMTFTRVK